MSMRLLDVGEGTPLVFVNGLFQSMDSWVSIADNLSRFYRVIAIDFPNQGTSTTDTSINTGRQYATFLLGVLDEIKIDVRDSVFFGYSFGAGILRHMLSQMSFSPRGVILGGSLPRSAFPYLIRRLENWLRLLDEGPFELWARTMMLDIFSPGWIAANGPTFDEINSLFIDSYVQRPLAARALTAAGLNSLRTALEGDEHFGCPVHVIGAEEDAMAPISLVRDFATRIGAREFHRLPGGHTLRIEALPQLIAALDRATRDIVEAV